MGSGRFDTDLYDVMQQKRAEAGQADFGYTAATQARPQKEWKSHPDLNPLGIKGVRESRDSDEHPASRGIVKIFDETGSMGEIPKILQQKLPKLHALILSKGGLDHPQICFGAIGDAYSDQAPFQIGQFESDNRMDEQLRNVFLEGNGGGQVHESYGLAFYFAARKTAMDCHEKRGEKGYLFMTGDEMPYNSLPRDHIKKVFGDNLEADIPIKTVLAEALEKFEVFFILATGGSHGKEPRVQKAWRDLLGERVLMLDDPSLVCELVASTIALTEGAELKEAVEGLGLDQQGEKAVSQALGPYAMAGVPPQIASASDPLPPGASRSGLKRL
jgi:hypothetical protein